MDAVKTEQIKKPSSGYMMLILMVAALAGGIFFMASEAPVVGAVCWVLFVFFAKGLLVIPPNTAKVMLLFGDYQGTVKESGLFWVNPFFSRLTVSMRARNFESEQLKVNDKMGNPVLISVILVWKVKDTYRASF
jgi:regulator of protease activity HflC (stomatin/prohibitin superfamily)